VKAAKISMVVNVTLLAAALSARGGGALTQP
jgi:hypothetical protein